MLLQGMSFGSLKTISFKNLLMGGADKARRRTSNPEKVTDFQERKAASGSSRDGTHPRRSSSADHWSIQRRTSHEDCPRVQSSICLTENEVRTIRSRSHSVRSRSCSERKPHRNDDRNNNDMTSIKNSSSKEARNKSSVKMHIAHVGSSPHNPYHSQTGITDVSCPGFGDTAGSTRQLAIPKPKEPSIDPVMPDQRSRSPASLDDLVVVALSEPPKHRLPRSSKSSTKTEQEGSQLPQASSAGMHLDQSEKVALNQGQTRIEKPKGSSHPRSKTRRSLSGSAQKIRNNDLEDVSVDRPCPPLPGLHSDPVPSFYDSTTPPSSRDLTPIPTPKKRKSKRKLFSAKTRDDGIQADDIPQSAAVSSCDEDIVGERKGYSRPARCSSAAGSDPSFSPVTFQIGDSYSADEACLTDSSDHAFSPLKTPTRRSKVSRQVSLPVELNPIREEDQAGHGFVPDVSAPNQPLGQGSCSGSFLNRARGEDTVAAELELLALPVLEEENYKVRSSKAKSKNDAVKPDDMESEKKKKKKKRSKRHLSLPASLEQAQEGVRMAFSLMEASMGVAGSEALTPVMMKDLQKPPDRTQEAQPGEEFHTSTMKRCARANKEPTLHSQPSLSSLASHLSTNPFCRVADADVRGSFLITEPTGTQRASVSSGIVRTGPNPARPPSETTLLLNNHKFLRPENLIEKDIRLLQDYDNPMMLAKATKAIQDHMREVTTKSNCCMGNKPEPMTWKDSGVHHQQGSPGPPGDHPRPSENGYGVHLHHEKWHSPYGKQDKPQSPRSKTDSHLLGVATHPEGNHSPRERQEHVHGVHSRTDSRGRSPGKTDMRGRSPGKTDMRGRSPGARSAPTHHGNGDVGHYVIDTSSGTTYIRGKLLGKGGFAKCYEMTDVKSKKSYAGKIIAKNRLAKPHQKEKILREIELHRMLRHRHVVSFHDYFEDEDNVYIILEMCRRKSLVHILKNRKTLTEPEVRFYMRHLVEGTRYIHEMKVIHRDLKLGNMLINDQMLIKIADFGLATKVEYEGEKKLTVCGTPNYIAPEVLQKRGHSYQADVWAMGCIMYAMLVGRPPFETTTLKETYMRITANKYSIPPHLSPQARALIHRLLHPNPAKRPTLESILLDDFFSGYMPKKLSTNCCEVAPKFPAQREPAKPERPRSYAAPTTSSEAMNKLTSSLAQLKGSQNSASQIITRAKTPDADQAVWGAEMETPARSGSTPAIIHDNGHMETAAATATAATHSQAFQMGAPTGLVPDVKAPPSGSAVKLYQLLTGCLEHMKSVERMPNTAVDPSMRPLWVSKWVDYSNKYGFGFQLSDKSVGILFNDTTRMLLASDAKTAQYNDLSNKVYTFGTEAAPSEYQKKVTLLLYFAQYMDEHLIPGGDVASQAQTAEAVTPSGIFMKKWFRTGKAIVMYLNNGTLQVNFFEDHTKVILSPERQDYLFTFVNSARQSSTYRLIQLRHFGATDDICERLAYSRRMLENIINIEGEAV